LLFFHNKISAHTSICQSIRVFYKSQTTLALLASALEAHPQYWRAAQQGNAVDAFGPEPVRFPMFVWASAQLIAVVRRLNVCRSVERLLYFHQWQSSHKRQICIMLLRHSTISIL
jgi:hypothetical protein